MKEEEVAVSISTCCQLRRNVQPISKGLPPSSPPPEGDTAPAAPLRWRYRSRQGVQDLKSASIQAKDRMQSCTPCTKLGTLPPSAKRPCCCINPGGLAPAKSKHFQNLASSQNFQINRAKIPHCRRLDRVRPVFTPLI